VKNITVSIPDEVYRAARIRAAEQGTSVSALVADYLRSLLPQDDEFTRLEALQRQIVAGIGVFRAGDRLSRDELHDRAVR
jgi:plasmid stability protein